MVTSLENALNEFRRTWHFHPTRSTVKQFSFKHRAQNEDITPAHGNITSGTPWQPIEHDWLASKGNNEILIASGWGNIASPLTITSDDFLVLCQKWNISPKILEAITPFHAELPNFFEYHIEQRNPAHKNDTQPCVLHLALKLDLRRRAYIMCIVRYDILNGQIKALIMDSGVLKRHNHGIPIPDSYNEVMQDNLEALSYDPLQLVHLLLEKFKSRFLDDFALVCKQIFATEGMIGVTKRARWLLKEGYAIRSNDYDDISAKLYKNQVDISRLMKTCSTLRVFAEQFQEIVDQTRHLPITSSSSNLDDGIYKQRSQTESMIKRLISVNFELEYAQNRLTSQFDILYNLTSQRDSRLQLTIAEAAKRDSSTMRAISILTLVFLPATFVSTVFSTSVFDFQKWQRQHDSKEIVEGASAVVSMGWWIYLMCCILCTLLVSMFWYLWTRKELRRSADKSEERLESGLQTSDQVNEAELEWDTE